MQVIGCLINNHLDLDCPALTSGKRQAQVDCPISSQATSEAQFVELAPTLGVPSLQNRQKFQRETCFDPRMTSMRNMGAQEAGGSILKNVKTEEETFLCIQAEDEEHPRENAHKKDGIVDENGFDSPENEGASISDLMTLKTSTAAGVDNSRIELRESDKVLHAATSGNTSINDPATINSTKERRSSGSEASTAVLIERSNMQWNFFSSWPVSKSPKGHVIVENFISPEEEDHLVRSLDMDLGNQWKLSTFNGLNMSKEYGTVMDLKQRMVRPAIFKMPKFLQAIIERMRTSVLLLKEFWPDMTNAIDYRKHDRHWLKPHVDDRQLAGTVLVNLSLAGACKMTYERERGYAETFKVLLKQRSIQILLGESRYSFTHSIQNEDLLGPRRVSLTFREAIWPSV